MSPLLLKIVMSCLISAAITAGLVTAFWEWKWLKGRGDLTQAAKRKMWLSLSALPPNTLVSILMAPVWMAIYSLAASRFDSTLPLSVPMLVVAILAADFSYYWEHRCAHRISALWILYHAFHHSGDSYTVTTAYRVSFLNQLLAPAFYIPWVLIGFHPMLIVGVQLFVFHYQAWLHTEMIGPLKWLDFWFNTPMNHRMHHSRALEHRLVNLGAVTIIWDRLFGTYVKPQSSVEYGVADMNPPDSILKLYIAPWSAYWRTRQST